VKSVPVIVTEVPPLVGPAEGATELTVGAATYVKLSAALVPLVPPNVVTVTSTGPAEPAGLVAVTCVALSTMKDVAAVEPKSTALAPAKLVPVMVTDVPPAVGPLAGETDVTVGDPVYVNSSSTVVALVPPAVVTVTATVPEPTGLVAVICVELSTVNVVAAEAPKLTTVAFVKSVPVIVTDVPPESGPPLGLTPVTVGAAT
jgi:hypothetical protein